MRIVFFGTPMFAAVHLEALIRRGYEICAIVTKVDKPRGRGGRVQSPEVKILAEQIAPTIPVFQPEKASSPEFIETISHFSPDLFVVVAYGEIMKSALLDLPKYGAINVHASLLPLLRGASPIQSALLEGHSQTGVTIMEMGVQMDAGAILAQQAIPVDLSMTASELEHAMLQFSPELLMYVIDHLQTCKEEKKEQDHSLATYVKKIQSADCLIDWGLDAMTLHNFIRAFSTKPGAYCFFESEAGKKRVKIFKTFPLLDQKGIPGEILSFDKKEFIVAARSGALRIDTLQVEGGKVMSAKEFMLGYSRPLSIG